MLVEHPEDAQIVFLPGFVAAVVVDHDGVAPHPLQIKALLAGKLHVFKVEVLVAKVVDHRVQLDDPPGIQGVEHVLVGQQQGVFVFVDVVDDLLGRLVAQQLQVHHHHAGVDVAGLLGQVQPQAVEVAEGAALDVGGSGEQVVAKVDLIQLAQRVEHHQIRVEVEDAVELLRQVVGGKQPVIHLGGVAVRDRRAGKQPLRHLDADRMDPREQGVQPLQVLLGQAVVDGVDGEVPLRVGLGKRVQHDAQHRQIVAVQRDQNVVGKGIWHGGKPPRKVLSNTACRLFSDKRRGTPIVPVRRMQKFPGTSGPASSATRPFC